MSSQACSSSVSGSSKPKQQSKLATLDINHPTLKCFPAELQPPDFQRSTFRWIGESTSVRQPETPTDVGLFQIVRNTLPNHVRLWNLVEISFPPVLGTKFHSMKISDVLENNRDKRESVVIWSVLWQRTFGIEYLNRVHQLSRELCVLDALEYIQDQNQTKSWQQKVDSVLQLISSASQLPIAPSQEDEAQKASEILLNPNVIIQLPWDIVLFHQWLAAAFTEVLVFEKNSLELRYWPLPPNLADIASRLLYLVRRLRERILIGFAIVYKQVINHGSKPDKNHPHWVLDSVVLPSLTTLEFLISGKASKIAKSIKKKSWPSSMSKVPPSYVYMSSTVYNMMDLKLEEMFLLMPYCYQTWEFGKIFHPFVEKACKDIDILRLIKLMQIKCKLEEASTESYHQHKDLSLLAIAPFTTRLLSPDTTHLHTGEQLMTTLLYVVKKVVINPGRIPQILEHLIHVSLFQPHICNSLLEIYNPLAKYARMHKALLAALAYTIRYVSLLGSESENSIMSQIVKLYSQFIEREYIIYLTLCISALVECSPIAVNLGKFTPMEVPVMMKILQMVEEGKRDREWLLSQFPEQWNQPVKPNEQYFKSTSEIQSILKKCEDRLGRIVLNSSQKSFELYPYNGVFPYLQTVQYILPSFITSIIQSSNNIEISWKFVHELLKFYENSYKDWLLKKKVMPILEIKNITELNDLKSCITYYLEVIKTYITSISASEDVISSLEIACKWAENEINPDLLVFMTSWYSNIYYMVINIYNVCNETWKPLIRLCKSEMSQLCKESEILYSFLHVCKLENNQVSCQYINEWFLQFLQNIATSNQENNIIMISAKTKLSILYNEFKEHLNKEKVNVNCLHLYPSQIQTALLKYHETGDLTSLDELLPLISEEITDQVLGNDGEESSKKCCSNCSEVEEKNDTFLICSKCIKEKFPFIKYFCSKTCEDKYWLKIHKEEHVDFLLGIGKFANLNVNE